MPRPAHRRCKERGPTCTGVAHPHFEICNRCRHDVVLPRQREEQAAVKARRARRLSKNNRALINEVDLKEPQMREEPKPMTVREAVSHTAIVNELALRVGIHEANGLDELDAVDAAASEMILAADMKRYTNIPIEVERAHLPDQPEVDPVVEVEEDRTALDGPPPEMPHSRRRPDGSTLTVAQRHEAAEAYVAGMPVEEICQAWRISLSTLYRTLGVLGISRRGQPAAHQTKESSVKVPTSSVTDSHVSRETPSANGTAPGLTEWVVTYQVTRTETVVVAARDFNAAAAAVEAEGMVISVARKV